MNDLPGVNETITPSSQPVIENQSVIFQPEKLPDPYQQILPQVFDIRGRLLDCPTTQLVAVYENILRFGRQSTGPLIDEAAFSLLRPFPQILEVDGHNIAPTKPKQVWGDPTDLDIIFTNGKEMHFYIRDGFQPNQKTLQIICIGTHEWTTRPINLNQLGDKTSQEALIVLNGLTKYLLEAQVAQSSLDPNSPIRGLAPLKELLSKIERHLPPKKEAPKPASSPQALEKTVNGTEPLKPIERFSPKVGSVLAAVKAVLKEYNLYDEDTFSQMTTSSQFQTHFEQMFQKLMSAKVLDRTIYLNISEGFEKTLSQALREQMGKIDLRVYNLEELEQFKAKRQKGQTIIDTSLALFTIDALNWQYDFLADSPLWSISSIMNNESLIVGRRLDSIVNALPEEDKNGLKRAVLKKLIGNYLSALPEDQLTPGKRKQLQRLVP